MTNLTPEHVKRLAIRAMCDNEALDAQGRNFDGDRIAPTFSLALVKVAREGRGLPHNAPLTEALYKIGWLS